MVVLDRVVDLLVLVNAKIVHAVNLIIIWVKIININLHARIVLQGRIKTHRAKLVVNCVRPAMLATWLNPNVLKQQTAFVLKYLHQCTKTKKISILQNHVHPIQKHYTMLVQVKKIASATLVILDQMEAHVLNVFAVNTNRQEGPLVARIVMQENFHLQLLQWTKYQKEPVSGVRQAHTQKQHLLRVWRARQAHIQNIEAQS